MSKGQREKRIEVDRIQITNMVYEWDTNWRRITRKRGNKKYEEKEQVKEENIEKENIEEKQKIMEARGVREKDLQFSCRTIGIFKNCKHKFKKNKHPYFMQQE